MGTHMAFSGRDLPDPRGRNGRELPLLVEARMTPLEAIEAATANGPLTLGPQAPLSGVLAEGYDADSSLSTATRLPTSGSWPTRTTSSASGAPGDGSNPDC